MGDVYEWADRMEMGMNEDRQGPAVVPAASSSKAAQRGRLAMEDDLELTELESFQQEQLDVLADALAHKGSCVKGDSIHCYDGGDYRSCQECWLGWAGEKAKRLLKGERHDD